MQLVVLGMHRSGTSGVTRLLNLAGAWFGPEGIATAANEENPRGFWERRDVRAACDGLLHGGGFDWWKASGFRVEDLPADVRHRGEAAFERILRGLDEHQPWVVKEPRLCLLFPLLRPLLSSPVCVHVTREPLEVAQSMHQRDGFPIQAALALWELYTVRAFEASEGLPRVLVRYEDLMADPVATTTMLVAELAELGVSGLHQVPDDEVHGFISPDLHRQRQDPAGRLDRLNRSQRALASAIDDGTILSGFAPAPVSVGGTEALDLLEHARGLAATHDELVGRIDQLEREVASQSRYREVELARRREVGRLAEEALQDLATRLDRLDRSRLGRVTSGLQAARQALTPGATRTTAGVLTQPLADLAARRLDIHALAQQDPAPGAGSEGTFATAHPLIRRNRAGRSVATADRPTLAVLSWDVGHNPLGRANVLAEVLSRRFDVELWGAQFDRYGSQIWAPLRRATTPVNVFPGRPFPEHLRTLGEVASAIDADALWVSKPRLPSYLLGILAKVQRQRPLVLDVDDHELAFFGEDEPLELAEVIGRSGTDDLAWPFERTWTRLCDGYIDAADQVTVSNVALQERYGGLIVPHARDEVRFDPARYDREAVRARLGVEPHERLLLFGGTPRAHKGVVEVLEAVDRLGDPRYRVLMFGTREFDELRERIGHLARWALVLPAQSFDDLPELVAAADLACVIQDPAHPVSRYQMPAKVSDALAMGVPCLVSRTPPLMPLIDEGVLQVLEPGDELHERIDRVFDDPLDAQHRADRGRELFLRELSYSAVADRIAPVFESLLEAPPPPSARLLDLANAPARAFAGSPGVSPIVRPARRPRRQVADPEPIDADATFDVVMFWKQNDSGLYGRRQDMILQELARSDRVATIVHFDNPVTPEALAQGYRAGIGHPSDQRRLVAGESLARALHRRDESGIHRHTFLYGGRYSRRLGRPPRSAYVDHVRSALAGHGIGTRPLLVWTYPSNDDLPELIDAIDPHVVVTDVVDDNRSWYEPGSAHVRRIEQNYEAVLGRSDLVLANCEPVAAAMAPYAPAVHVVPNGCEMPSAEPAGPRPPSLRGLTGPVVAYVGNLSARLDLALIEGVARARPDWNLVFVGSAHLDRSILALRQLPNVHFAGVMPYPEVRRFLRHVDVAMVPHVDNEMTRSMNPLKVFVYASAGVPVVSTSVANLAELDGLVRVADGVDGFVDAVATALAVGRPTIDLDVLRAHSWTTRVEHIFDLLDAELARRSTTERDRTGRPPS